MENLFTLSRLWNKTQQKPIWLAARRELASSGACSGKRFPKLESQVMRRNDSPHENWKVNALFRIKGQVSAACLTASFQKMY